MSIPCKMRPAGLDSLPMGYFRAEFLEASASSTVIRFPFSYKTEDTVRMEWSTERTQSEGIDYLRVFGGAVTQGGLGPDGNDPDETKRKRFSSTSYLRPTSYMQSLFIFNDTFINFKVYNDGRKNTNIISKDKAIVNGVTRNVVGAYDIEESPFSFPGWGNGWAIGLRISLFDQRSEKEVKKHLIPTISSSGRPCLFDTVSKQSHYNSGTEEFIVGLTTKQALNLANLPATGGSLTVSLPLEATFDEAVQSALNTATDKGWTITVQYRGYIEADFLENTGTQWIDTLYIPNNETGLYAYWQPTGISNAHAVSSMNGGIYGFTIARYSTSGTSGYHFGAWWAPNAYNCAVGDFLEAELNFRNNRRVWVTNLTNTAQKWNRELKSYAGTGGANPQEDLCYTPEHSFYLFGSDVAGRFDYALIGRIYSAVISQEENIARNFIPALSPSGRPCMYDTVTKTSFYNQGTGEFIVGFETTEKAAISISKLPITTDGTLTVSLPAEAQDAASLVPEAINIATRRGWTIITQYRED